MRLYTKENIDRIEKFLKESTENFKDFSDGCCRFILDDKLGLFVGWLPGYDPEDTKTDYIDANGWGLNAGIKIRNDFYWAEYDSLNAPIWLDKNGEETGEVAMTDITISRNEDFRRLARYYLREYIGICKELKAKRLSVEF